MIREWLATWRRRARADVGPALDTAVFLGAQFDFAAAQMEGLRDALAEALQRADTAERRAAVLEARLARYEYVELQRRGLAYHMARGEEARRRVEDEPTVRARAMGRASGRPAPATEQYRRPR